MSIHRPQGWVSDGKPFPTQDHTLLRMLYRVRGLEGSDTLGTSSPRNARSRRKKDIRERPISSGYDRLDGAALSPSNFSFLFLFRIPSDMELGSRRYPFSGPLPWDPMK